MNALIDELSRDFSSTFSPSLKHSNLLKRKRERERKKCVHRGKFFHAFISFFSWECFKTERVYFFNLRTNVKHSMYRKNEKKNERRNWERKRDTWKIFLSVWRVCVFDVNFKKSESSLIWHWMEYFSSFSLTHLFHSPLIYMYLYIKA
jgi:hypothetical protein